MSPELTQKVLDYAQVTGRALYLANQEIKKAESQKSAAAAKVAKVAAALKKAGFISDAEEAKAASQLSKHAAALDIIVNLVDTFQEQKSASAGLGHGVTSDEHVAKSAGRRYFGHKSASSEIRPSDEALLKLARQ